MHARFSAVLSNPKLDLYAHILIINFKLCFWYKFVNRAWNQGVETSCLCVCTKRVCVCNKELNSCTVGVYSTDESWYLYSLGEYISLLLHIFIYKVVISVCQFVCPIITQEPFNRFTSKFDWETWLNRGNILSLV